MSLLSICQDAAIVLGLPVPALVVGAQDANTPILFRLANQSGMQLMRRHDWQVLTIEHTWLTTATQAQADALPSDYDRLRYNTVVWNRSAQQPLNGPTDGRSWSTIQTGIATGGWGWWRILGGALNILPVVSVGLTYGLEYVSKNWAKDAGGVPKAAFTADTDESRIPEDLIVLELVWRYKSAKKFGYAEEMATAEREIERACSRDRGTGIATGSSQPQRDWLNSNTWPGVITS